LKIKIYYDNIKFRLRETSSIKKFLEKVIRGESRIPGDLHFIFTNDENIRKINYGFMNHDYYTDVISFGNNDGKYLDGEVYISIDTVRSNARIYKVRVKEEILRVMIHGVLHLCGYEDDTSTRKEEMFRLQEKKVNEFKWNS
jgi:rRNA maturation RNase YbeY